MCIWWEAVCYFYLTHRESWGHLAVLPQSDLHDSMALNQSRRNRVTCQHWKKRQALKLNGMCSCVRGVKR